MVFISIIIRSIVIFFCRVRVSGSSDIFFFIFIPLFGKHSNLLCLSLSIHLCFVQLYFSFQRKNLCLHSCVCSVWCDVGLCREQKKIHMKHKGGKWRDLGLNGPLDFSGLHCSSIGFVLWARPGQREVVCSDESNSEGQGMMILFEMEEDFEYNVHIFWTQCSCSSSSRDEHIQGLYNLVMIREQSIVIIILFWKGNTLCQSHSFLHCYYSVIACFFLQHVNV